MNWKSPLAAFGIFLLLVASSMGQGLRPDQGTRTAGGQSKPSTGGIGAAGNDATQRETQRRMDEIKKMEIGGVNVRLKDVSRFRGVRTNRLTGVGVVVGLEGTGDTKRNPMVARAIANYLRTMGKDVDYNTIDPKNGAMVMVTAELPPFSTNGAEMDITVSTLGDAKSLRGGTLLQTELFAVGDSTTVYAIGSGSVSIGGYSAGAGGNKDQVGFLTAGRIPGGAIVERGAPTKVVYDGKIYIELDSADFTTATRVQQAIQKKYPMFQAVAEDAGVVSIVLPAGTSAPMALAQLEAVQVQVDNEALVVVNERTGSIAIGGNVRIAPVAIATGSISVRIQEEVAVSQPNPFSNGETTVVKNQGVQASERDADVAIVAPNATVADLARIFQELRLRATEIINILQLLQQQGALKARVVIQ